MAFVEDMSIFFADFGVPVIFESQEAVGILDEPSRAYDDTGMRINDREYVLTLKAEGLERVPKSGTVLEIDGKRYVAKAPPEYAVDGKTMTVAVKRA